MVTEILIVNNILFEMKRWAIQAADIKHYFIIIHYKMPYVIRKVSRKNCYRVSKKTKKNRNKKVFSKCATRKNAIKQMRLLRALQFNKNFVPNSAITYK